MNAPTKITPETVAEIDPLAKLRLPFPDNQVSKLPKETKKQAADRNAAQDKGTWPQRCNVCGGLHHQNAVHLDYVGHAALTDRLLDTDLRWTWEPVAFTAEGLPALDRNGGLWIKLTVCGMTRLGYGAADGKTGGDAMKELIGDALRNAAMRFGAALDLWHKGDLHAPGDEEQAPRVSAAELAIRLLCDCKDAAEFKEAWEKNKDGWKKVLSAEDATRVWAAKDDMVAKFKRQAEAAKPPEGGSSGPMEMADGTPFDDSIPFISDRSIR